MEPDFVVQSVLGPACKASYAPVKQKPRAAAHRDKARKTSTEKKSEDRWIALNWTWEHRRSKYVNFHFYSTTGGLSYLASVVVYAQAREKSNSYVFFCIWMGYGCCGEFVYVLRLLCHPTTVVFPFFAISALNTPAWYYLLSMLCCARSFDFDARTRAQHRTHFFPIATSPPPLVPHSARCSVVMCVHKGLFAILQYYLCVQIHVFLFFSYSLFSSFLSARRTILLFSFSTHSLHLPRFKLWWWYLNWIEPKQNALSLQ